MKKSVVNSSEAVKTLTPREHEVFIYLLTKMNAHEIASAAGMNINTFRFHYKNVYKKLQVHSRHELILRYIEYADRNADQNEKQRHPR